MTLHDTIRLNMTWNKLTNLEFWFFLPSRWRLPQCRTWCWCRGRASERSPGSWSTFRGWNSREVELPDDQVRRIPSRFPAAWWPPAWRRPWLAGSSPRRDRLDRRPEFQASNKTQSNFIFTNPNYIIFILSKSSIFNNYCQNLHI